MQSSLGQQNIQQPVQQYAPQYQTAPIQQQAPQTCQQVQSQAPQAQSAQGQNVQVPNYSGVNIQIFNPSVTPPGATAPVYNVNAPNYGGTPVNGCYPSNYYTSQFADGANGKQGNGANANGANGTDMNGAAAGANGQTNAANNSTTNSTENKTTDKKTEKREIVQLTDEYIKNLENYLNSQDKEVRMMGAKEVIARLEEDNSRKDDKALNALVNKMLQDPYTPIRILALSALDSRAVTGDELTVGLLKQMQNSQGGYGQDAMQATETLLKMSGKKVEKEFEVKDDKKKTETKKEEKTEETQTK